MKLKIARPALFLAATAASAAVISSGDAAGETTRAADAASPTPAWTTPTAWTGEAAAGAMPGWPEIRPEARPGSYWWWPGSAVTRADLTWNLETYQQAGWGNMGVIGIYGVKGEEGARSPFSRLTGSPCSTTPSAKRGGSG